MTIGDRHSSNTNDRGSAEARRARKHWLLDVFGADVDVVEADEIYELDLAFGEDGRWVVTDNYYANLDVETGWFVLPKGLGRPACRCFRCGKLVTYETMEVDRIKPGADGGTYARNNIRPVCPGCNKKIEGEARRKRNAKRKRRNEARRRARAETYESHA